MELIQIYQCLCEPTRLRMLQLLSQGPLCVCHFQGILSIPQTKVSQHLAYLRKRQMVETTRQGTWIIYSLPAKMPRELEINLKCLQDCAQSDKKFQDDLRKLKAIRKETDWVGKARRKACCP